MISSPDYYYLPRRVPVATDSRHSEEPHPSTGCGLWNTNCGCLRRVRSESSAINTNIDLIIPERCPSEFDSRKNQSTPYHFIAESLEALNKNSSLPPIQNPDKSLADFHIRGSDRCQSSTEKNSTQNCDNTDYTNKEKSKICLDRSPSFALAPSETITSTSINPQAFLSTNVPALNYPDTRSQEEMLRHEAIHAIQILNDSQNQTMLKSIASQIMQRVLKMDNELFEDFLTSKQDDIEHRYFPISKLIDYSEKQAFIESVFRLIAAKENRTADILSAIWRLPTLLLEETDSNLFNCIGSIYAKFQIIGRYHKVHFHWDLPLNGNLHANFYYLNEGQLGAAQISSPLLTNFQPIKMLNQYYTLLPKSSDMPKYSLCKINKRLGLPYLSGISGMSNSFYSVYPLLGIDYKSPKGLRLAGIMSAFTVAIGFHTFQESCNGFFITHKYCNDPGQLMKDFKSGTGSFASTQPAEITR